MSFLFGRLARLTIGVPGQTGKVFDSFSRDQKTGIITPGLRFSFSIEKTAEAAPNKMTIELYNLNDNSVAITKKSGATVVLEAGYGNMLTDQWAADNNAPASLLQSTMAVIYRGDIAKSNTIKKGGDWITTIESGDGLNAYQTSKLEASFAPGASTSSVIDSAIGAMGLGKGDITSSVSQYINGATFSGNARDILDNVTEKNGDEWSIQDGLVQINPKNSHNKEEIILIDAQSGLIGSPSNTYFGGSKASGGFINGVQFSSFLQPGLRPGRRVQVNSKKVNGIFVIRKVNHKGDTKQGEWASAVEALEL